MSSIWRRGDFRNVAKVLFAVIALTALSCGGGGSSPTTPTPPTPPPPPSPGVFFTASATPGANTIYLAGPTSNNPNAFTLEVHASQVMDLYGLGFDLNFPNALLSHSDSNRSNIHEGTFLSEGGQVNTELLRDRGPGVLTLGHTRVGDVDGVDGSGLLFSLDFTTDRAGTGEFTITSRAALDSDGEEQAEVVWLAGTFEVRF